MPLIEAILNRLGKPSVPESVPELVTIWVYRLTQTSYSDMRRLIEFYFFDPGVCSCEFKVCLI